jgi:hypothetical protein
MILARSNSATAPEHGHRELVLGIVDVIPALDDDLLAVLEELAEDDRLMRDITGDAIGIEEIHRVEDRSDSQGRGPERPIS